MRFVELNTLTVMVLSSVAFASEEMQGVMTLFGSGASENFCLKGKGRIPVHTSIARTMRSARTAEIVPKRTVWRC